MSSSSPSRGSEHVGGLYLHVPFCARACPYCDFDFRVERNPDAGAYVAGLAREFEARRGTWVAHRFDTIYLGGGTPSVLGPTGLAAVLAWCKREVPRAAQAEISVELNPEHVDDALVRVLVEQGVSRVSLGIQTFDDAGLRTLGRRHSCADAVAAIDRLTRAELTVAVDLIVGWPGQRDAGLDADVCRVVDSPAAHASVYGLTIDAGVPWHRLVRRGLRTYPDGDRQADLLMRAADRLVAAGWDHYEISNYARAGSRSHHNDKYWTGGDYFGLGPSAASARQVWAGAVVRETNPRGVTAWLDAQWPGGSIVERVDGSAAAGEALWLGLRRLQGVEVEAFLARHPAVDRTWLAARVGRQIERGNLIWTSVAAPREGLALAPDRWLWHDEVGLDLLGD